MEFMPIIASVLLLAILIAGYGWLIDSYVKKTNAPKIDNLQNQVNDLKRELEEMKQKQ